MRAFVFYIWFVCFVLCGCAAADGNVQEALAAEAGSMCQRLSEEAVPSGDVAAGVLCEANRFADVSFRPTQSVNPNLVRRPRTAGAALDRLFPLLAARRSAGANHFFKITLRSSQVRAALQMVGGYYVYALRRILV